MGLQEAHGGRFACVSLSVPEPGGPAIRDQSRGPARLGCREQPAKLT